MSRGPSVHLSYCKVDKMSPAIGSTIGPAPKIVKAEQKVSWNAPGMPRSPSVNLYDCKVDKMSTAIRG